MATIILTFIGQKLAGPIGAIIGASIGNRIDQKLLGGGGRREGPRLNDLSIQSAAYGQPLPRLYGTTRVAGTVIWSSGLIERRQKKKVGGKGGQKITEYSYSAHLAIALSARPVVSVGRIWADGKLIRQAGGAISTGGVLRLHTGSANQAPDPLLEAQLGPDETPAYRGLAYAVLEGMELGEFANRIPNLTFEVAADAQADAALAAIFPDLAREHPFDGSGLSARIGGLALAGASARSVLDALAQIRPHIISAGSAGLAARDLPAEGGLALDRDHTGAGPAGEPGARLRRSALQPAALPSEIAVIHADPARDYQPNVQRARLGPAGGEVEAIDLPVTMTPVDAKQSAERALARAWRRRTKLELNLPHRYARLEPGDAVTLPGLAPGVWLTDELEFSAKGLRLALSPLAAADNSAYDQADGGSGGAQVLQPQGPSTLHVLDLPPVGAAGEAAPRLTAFGGGSAAWRSATLWLSFDGAAYAAAGNLTSQCVLGTARTVLPPASPAIWDERSSLIVDMANASLTLESATAGDVLAGANAAMLGDELIQFRSAAPRSDGSYELTGLLRGRRGTEAAVFGHAAGDRFTLLELEDGLPLPVPVSRLGQTVYVKALGPGETLASVQAAQALFHARALRPLSPVHGRAIAQGADLLISWIRRSRTGFDWIGSVDAPLGEDAELYDLEIRRGGALVRILRLTEPSYLYAQSQQAEDAAVYPGALSFKVAQLSAAAGLGAPLTILP